MCGRSFRPVRQAISKPYDRSSQKIRRWRGRTTTIASRCTSPCARIVSTSFASCSSTIATRWISGWTTIRSEIARDRGYTEMEQLLTHTLDTKFNASPQGSRSRRRCGTTI